MKCTGLKEQDLRSVVSEGGRELEVEFEGSVERRPAELTTPFRLSQKQEYLCLRSSSGSGLGWTMLSCSG